MSAYVHTVRYLRISPKKLRLVAREVKGRSLKAALTWLTIQPQSGAAYLKSALEAARNNAQQGGLSLDEFRVAGISCQKGPTFMRRWIRAKGRSLPKRKPTAHLRLVFKS